MNVSSRTVVLLNVLAAAGLFLTLSSKYNWF
ncbi:stress response membrane protein YncL [Pseudescherichia vulneris]|nr:MULTISPECIES: stress response membrane protein YncL [Enterobacteriaceae]POT99619.1 stress response membrane protein YncL [Escherichia sp. ESNIH1]WAH53203.1 stress response membrane protein YncL [Pseudescherichia vulneris]